VLAAVGHFRHGILLAPLTAAAVVDLVAHGTVPPLLESLAPV
jgi:glycine/D-amino acid oxidase-like deaminating enzyme